ncbi:hypothetical protein WKW77_25155 [Variovorax ureilyticus]|uniref:Uncharacterized protein n=1 Tax=Variovorax ureilyticus TaxID=1836198 RepID=A0ABU8VLE0_9BURK
MLKVSNWPKFDRQAHIQFPFASMPSLAPKGKLPVSRSLALASYAVLLKARCRLSGLCIKSGNHRIELGALRNGGVHVQSNTSLVGVQFLGDDAVLLD